jgi:ABC-type dipeptide/oligopeptide/nickel transport system ATPase subunit
MGIPVLILGESGSGKSTSMRNFEENEVGVFNVASKPLPFRKKLNKFDNATYQRIYKSLGEPKLKKYVIDDSQYLMAFESFDHAKETGYGKFTNMALNFRNLIDFIIRGTPNDVIVYMLHHTELTDDGKLKAKTLGKMLDNQLTVEGLFSIVLLCQVEGTEHFFITNSDGSNPAKSPMEMFEMKIDNDLKAVDMAVREYYELSGGKENEQTK